MGRRADEELYQASMGIYVFNRQVLIDVLANNDGTDFGKHIIPGAIRQYRVNAYIFQDYWEDIGTIRAFFDANLALTDIIPPYSFFDRSAPIYTRARFLARQQDQRRQHPQRGDLGRLHHLRRAAWNVASSASAA